MDFFSILTLIGGLALFLYGMNTMGDGLKKLAGGKLELVLERLTSNRFKGFLLGLLVTAAIQSSSASISMLVGFVNSGIMRLGQTLSIILGANIGTTITAWILSLSGIHGDSFLIRMLQPKSFTPILAIIGICMAMFSKSDKKKDIGTIMVGFAVLMFGMETMSGAMSGLKESASFSRLMVMFSNPFMGILIGTVLTAIIQSSSASVGILQALSATGAISYSVAIPLIMGQNLGAAITPLLSAIGGNAEAKRVAIAGLYIKIIGVAAVALVFYLLHSVMNFAFMDQSVNAVTVAIVHTSFNLFATVVLMPFCGAIEKLATKTVRGGKKPSSEPDALDKLDDRFLSMPSFAVEKSRTLVADMAVIAQSAMSEAFSLIGTFDRETIEKIQKSEELVDRYEDKISTYLLKVAALKLSRQDSREVTQLLHVIGDVERISDHAVNVMEVAEEIHDKNVFFSEDARREIAVMVNAVSEVLELATNALVNEDMELAKRVEPLEQRIDKLKHKIKNHHILRLRDGDCTVELGFILSDLLTNCERVADHCSNIAVCLLEMRNDSFETHEYLQHVKEEGENEFFENYEHYKKKYSL